MVVQRAPGWITAPLQVAVARLLGYHWPQQAMDDLDGLADEDGIVCLPSVTGEAALGGALAQSCWCRPMVTAWVSERTEAELLAAAGAAGKSLDEWLREDFFAQHCRLFHNRPFVWHIWDGRKDGFSALVNYHKLDAARLDKLIFTYLGDWIRFQRARRDHGEPGADGRLVAALELEKKLKLIKEGEPPYDIYVRWKPLSKQPLGWNPDLNDGVRLNIRPFVTAGVLRSRFTINWNKDRGKNPDGSERLNDLHYTLAEKRSAKIKEEAITTISIELRKLLENAIPNVRERAERAGGCTVEHICGQPSRPVPGMTEAQRRMRRRDCVPGRAS